DFFFADNEQLFVVNLDGLAGILTKQYFVARLDIEWDHLAVLGAFPRAYGNNFALIWLFSSAIRYHDTCSGGALVFQALDDHSIVQRTQCHIYTPVSIENWII